MRKCSRSAEKVLDRQLLGHEKHFVNRFARPIAAAQLFHGEQQHAATHTFASAEEFLSFFVGADAKNCEGPLSHRSLLHRDPRCKRK